MPDREKVLRALQVCSRLEPDDVCPDDCPYAKGMYCGTVGLLQDALELLKAQEPRLVVKEDFVNADRWGYLPVYVEDRDGDMYWDCITDAALGDTVSRFWTEKPTDKQRKELKWDDA